MSVVIPWYKKLLSYVMDVELEATSSIHNPKLYVTMRQGSLMLTTDNAIYSFGKRYTNFGEVLKKMNWKGGEEILLLGFGLGSIPVIIEKSLGHLLSYTGVELDEEVIYLASKYILPELESKIELHSTDAELFVHSDENTYDVIAMDVFESDYIPEKFETKTFLESVKKRLKKDGVLLYNRLAFDKKDAEESLEFYDKRFKVVFPLSDYKRVKGNLILIGKTE